MHRSSATIGSIAAALAKAQCELTNPEKSLVGLLPSPSPREAARSFRYTPLSAGLDIVRKSLGHHEIATVQTTEIDKDAGLVRLTTVLAHASGEWFSSDWPVCSIGDMAVPQRMGTALTYARRYSLFALVGIAGEDDKDAPALPSVEPVENSAKANGHAARGPSPNGSRGRLAPRRMLSAEDSAKLRERLLAELGELASSEELDGWVNRILPAKNTLAAQDARRLERAFEAKLSDLSGSNQPAAVDPGVNSSQLPSTSLPSRRPLASRPIRRRSKKHLEHVAAQPCLICGRTPSDAHHLRFAQPRALGRKVSDEFTVPLCRTHHRELHDRGDEIAWWEAYSMNPSAIAEELWGETQGRAYPPQSQAPANALS